MSTKVCGIFLFYLDLELFAKFKKDLVSTHSFFTLILITQDLNKIKKIPHTLVDITKQETCTKVCEIFLFYLDLDLFAKIKKDLVSTYLFFTLLLITQDLNKIK